MNEGLEALERLMTNYYEMCQDLGDNDDQYQRYNLTSERAIIEKELKEGEKNKQVLDIIVHKGVNVGYLKDAWNHNEKVNYNKDLIITDDTIRVLACKDSTPLTQEEYDILKRYCYKKNN